MENLGKRIEEVFDKSGMTKTAFADKIGYSRNNVYNIFNRKTIDLNLLKKIGSVLDYNFLEEYQSRELVEEPHTEYRTAKKSKISLMIELDPGDDIFMNEAFSNKLKELMKIVSQ